MIGRHISPKVDKEPEYISIIERNTIRFRCSVPWPASYCYIRAPDGELIKGGGLAMDHLLQAGVCIITTKVI